MYLTRQQVIGKWVGYPTPAQEANIDHLVAKVNALMQVMIHDGVVFRTNPKTGSIVSGETLGGFRPKDAQVGAFNSAHKQGMSVDIYDPDGKIDAWLYKHQDVLKSSGLWFEHPSATDGWSHWSIRQPKSGNRFFYP